MPKFPVNLRFLYEIVNVIMTIIVFLIDTSASMNQRAYLGGRPKLLDIAKGAVETFVKVR